MTLIILMKAGDDDNNDDDDNSDIDYGNHQRFGECGNVKVDSKRRSGKSGPSKDSLLSSQYHREKSVLQEIAARREAERARMSITKSKCTAKISSSNKVKASKMKTKSSKETIYSTRTTTSTCSSSSMSSRGVAVRAMHKQGYGRRIDVFSGTCIGVKSIY